jgi:hypothetical protein
MTSVAFRELRSGPVAVVACNGAGVARFRGIQTREQPGGVERHQVFAR